MCKICEIIGKNSMVRGRPEKYPVKKVIGFAQEMLDAIDEWRRQQKPIPTVSDAIRALVQQGLEKGAGEKWQ
jgi:regulatory protein YycI of two-component signal transduction system YycFG